MEVHQVDPKIVSKIKSSSTINSVTQCIMELVLNSLDAKSTAIAVRTNLISFRIQVVDNGDGITKDNLNLIGQRYMTSKCKSLRQLETQCTYFGFRGEALASIINISEKVEITTKVKNESETGGRIFEKTSNNRVALVKDRPSSGTTVTIEGFLHNFPLRKNRVIPEVELALIKSNIVRLIIMHPNVSFSLRNDVTGDLILNNKKCKNIISSFRSLHPEIKQECSLIRISKNAVAIKGLLFKEMLETNCLQYIYVNKRPVKCPKIQAFVHTLLWKNAKYLKKVFAFDTLITKNKHPIYILNIKCPCSFVDILSSPTKTVVEFKNWELVFNCIKKLLFSFLGITDKSIKENQVRTCRNVKSTGGISQLNGVFTGYGIKRQNKENADQKPVHSQKDDSMNEIFACSNNTKNGKRKMVSNELIPTPTQSQSKRSKQGDLNNFKNTNNISEFSSNTITNQDTKQKVHKGQRFEGKMKDVRKVNDFIAPKPPPHKNIRPLPIEISNKNLRTKSSKEINIFPCKEPEIEENEDVIPDSVALPEVNVHKLPDEQSFMSKFTNDENKGKNLIMDMFLKSTQVFNSEEDDQSETKSGDTVLELESNYFLQNNVTTNINGQSKTMSVSINIKRHMKKKRKSRKNRKTAKSIQTSQDDNKMVSKCVQTSLYQNNGDSFHDRSSNYTKLAENCTVILSTSNFKTPYFKFIHRDAPEKPEMWFEESKCNCNCHSNVGNFFNFDNLVPRKLVERSFKQTEAGKRLNVNFCRNNLYPMEIPQIYATHNKVIPQKNKERNEKCITVTKDVQKPLQLGKVKETHHENVFVKNRSPYFSKDYRLLSEKIFSRKPRFRDKGFDYFRPHHQSTQENNNYEEFGVHNAHFSVCSRINVGDKNTVVNADESKYSFRLLPGPSLKSTGTYQVSKSTSDLKEQTDEVQFIDIFSNDSQENCDPKKGFDYTFQDCLKSSQEKSVCANPIRKTPSAFGDELFITLSNRQRQELLEKELDCAKNIANKINLEWESQCKEREDDIPHEPDECDQEWIRKRNNFGSTFYVNRKTGFATFYTPKPVSNIFKLCKRFEFMPKGLSPIMTETREVDDSLSQNKKEKLQNYILESYQDELLVIKWQNYLKNQDPKAFFDEVYKEKLNQIQHCIPSALHSKRFFPKLNHPISFDKALFKNIVVIGQVDKKFIAVLEKTTCLLILFDQHAVHERIRLEGLIEGYSTTKVSSYENKLIVSLSCNDLSLLKKNEEYLISLGLRVVFYKECIDIVEIPSCLYYKFKDSDITNELNSILELLIKDIINLIKETGGVTIKKFPRIIQNIMNLEACRGAIKFGDKLTNSECEQLLQKLSCCNLPFQCAHGRPTLVPVLSLKSNISYVVNTINLEKLLKCK